MKKCDAATIDEALETLNFMRRFAPFAWSGIAYLVFDSEFRCAKFYVREPKTVKPNQTLCRIIK